MRPRGLFGDARSSFATIEFGQDAVQRDTLGAQQHHQVEKQVRRFADKLVARAGQRRDNALDRFQVNFMEGQQLLLLMFAGITLGGLGTAFGAAAGCFLLGLAIQLSTLFIPTSLRNVGALVVLIVVLMFAPQGIFGRRERVG